MPDFWKDKKILVYIALIHHTRFLSPITDKLTRQGAKVRYVVGQAERSQEITAISLNLDYIHVFDSISKKDRADVQENYIRLRDTFSACLNSGYLFSETPATVIDKTLYSTAMEYIGFRNIISQEKPDLCFALHELNRWGKMLSFWAKKSNIPVLTFQEGLYYGLDFGYTGHLQHSTFNLVWGNRIKNKLKDFEAPPDRIIKVGNTHLAGEMEYQTKNRIREKKRKAHDCLNKFIILLLFSSEIPDTRLLDPVFKAVANSKEKKLFIKFHPTAKFDQVKRWTALIPKDCRSEIEIFSGDESYYDLLSASDVCVLAQPSTTGLEALFFGKPLVHLDLKMQWTLPYSFLDFKVAVKMTPEEFAGAILKNIDFTSLIHKKDIENYIENELSDTKNAVRNVVDISKTIIQANQSPDPPPLQAKKQTDKKWSIIIELSKNADTILKQLEALARNSEDSGPFEVIMIEPTSLSKKADQILGTMKGDIFRLPREKGQRLPDLMNKAAELASGETLVFIKKNLLVHENWLVHLGKGIDKYGKQSLFGARILNSRGSISHAGMAIDKNNSPISVFRHLEHNFPNALKDGPFQLLDQAIAINKRHFCSLGGFWEKTGAFAFMDLCLRADTINKSCCIYLHKTCMTALKDENETDPDHALYFYGKWHGRLWESLDDFLKKQNLTPAQVDTARLTHSMATLYK